MIAIGQITIAIVNDGSQGPQGPQGTSVTKVVREYTKSSSSSTLPSNPNWSETEPTIGANEYLWARDRTDLSDGTSTYGPAICSTNISGVKHDVDKANKSITDKVWESDITTKINQYDGSTVSTIRDRLSTTETDISGIKTRVSDVESETDDLGTRMSTAETTIDQTANNVLIKATKSDTTAAQGGQHLIESLINVAPSGVTISADKVNIEGATIFSSGRLSQTSLNNAYDAKGAAATVQTNLDNLEIGGRNLLLSSANMSSNKHSPSGTYEFIDDYVKITTTSKAWYEFMLSTKCRDLDLIKDAKSLSISMDVKMENAGEGALYVELITVSNDNLGSRVRSDSQTIYISSNFPTEWTRVSGIASADRSTWVKNNDNTEIGVTAHIYWYNTGTVYIRKPKLEIGNKPTSWTPAPEDVDAQSLSVTEPIYYRSPSSTTPTISASTTIGTSNNTDNSWTYVMPIPKRNSYFFTCERQVHPDGSVTFSTVRPLDSQTYASKWVSSADNTYIDGGRLYAHSVTTGQLATDAIKSNNYQAAASGPYSVTGTFLDLSNGNFYTPNFGVQSLTGQAYLNGEIIATSGSIGDDSGNYWSIGNTIDSQGNGSASIVGNGTAYIQDGDWQIHSGLSNYSNGSINTQWYIQPQGQGLQLTYPYYDGYYYDYGMTSPVLDANSDRFYNQTVSQNFLYIRKHASTIPELESDWNYIFRIDKDGMIWINGQSLTQMIQSGVDGGAYLPTSGGTVNGNVTITGTLTATASKANQLTHTLSINGKGFDGSGDVNVGTIGAAYGGTGQTSLINSANALLNALGTGSSTPVDADYYISQYVGGGTTTTTYHRRPMSALWSYIKGKLTNDHSALDSSYVLKSGDTITGSLTVENGIYSDSAQLGDLIVTGAGRFANGLYGDLIGNADTATKAAKVADSGNGTETTFAYSKSGLTTASWIAAWNNYELRAISPANVLKTIGADKSASISDRINTVGSGNYNWTSFTYDDKLITSNTLAYWNGAYNSSSHASNIEYVKAGKLGDIVTHNASEFLTTSGNAASASKFNSTRKIELTGDVTGSASSDGSSGWSIATTVQDNSHNHVPSNIVPGNDYTAGNLDWIASAKIGSAASNKSFGLPAEAITIEYSTDGGSTWLDYGASDSAKRDLFNEIGNNYLLGKAATQSANTTNCQLRITIKATDRYVYVKGVYIWVGSRGNGMTMDFDAAKMGSQTTFVNVFSDRPLGGNSGPNIQYFSPIVFGGYSGQNDNWYVYRFTFKQPTVYAAATAASMVSDIRLLGDMVWISPNNMVSRNHMYTWDRDFNVTFPAGITATSFTGNASSASKLNSTRSFTIGNTAKNVDWSGAVSFTKAEISDDASSTANGWMSVADKKKLDSITVSDIGTIGANSIRGEKDIKVTISSGIATIGHENAAITAGTISGTATSTLSNGGSFKIPSITYDAYGHITGTAQTTITLPNITSVSGNAGTATKFSSARAISLSGDVSGTATADGSSGWSITTRAYYLTHALNRPASANVVNTDHLRQIYSFLASSAMTEGKPMSDGTIIHFSWDNSGWAGQLYIPNSKNLHMQFRGGDNSSGNTNWEDWKTILDSTNYTDYTVTKTGTGASGTWGININGEADSATKDGSGNTITSTYAKLSGATFTGAVNTPNNTYNKIGDDVQIGDINVAGTLGIKGINGATGIRLVPYSGSTATDIHTDGSGNLTITGNTIGKFQGTPTSVSWRQGRDSAIFKSTVANGYSATMSVKTSNGTWDIGSYTSSYVDDLIFSHITDTDYNAGNNTVTAQIRFQEDGHIVANGFDGTASRATADASGNTITSTYVNLTGTQTISGAKTFSTMPLASAGICVNNGSGTAGGVSFWSDKTVENYGIALRTTANGGKHGFVQGDYATYNYMYASSDAASLTRGWVFKNNRVSKNVASIGAEGDAAFNGEVAIGTTGTNLSGSVSLVMDHDLNCLNFIFN